MHVKPSGFRIKGKNVEKGSRMTGCVLKVFLRCWRRNRKIKTPWWMKVYCLMPLACELFCKLTYLALPNLNMGNLSTLTLSWPILMLIMETKSIVKRAGNRQKYSFWTMKKSQNSKRFLKLSPMTLLAGFAAPPNLPYLESLPVVLTHFNVYI